jgi:peptide-methionine (S)-S-oxide reductase
MQNNSETIIFGGGCFWCVEAAFQDVKGVKKVISGYAGGETTNPTYKSVSSGETGHAEAVSVELNPAEISLEKILEIFFIVHNPTTLNRQGHDVGTQYRSMILYSDDNQKKIIENFISKHQEKYRDKIVTEVKKLEKFYPAEEYHQNYFKKNPDLAYCQHVIQPKMEKLKEKLAGDLK